MKNSFDVAEELSSYNLEPDEQLFSFDVTALYPNVPIEAALDVLKDWIDTQEIPDDQKELYFELSRLCMKQTIFQFRGKYYRQVKGTSMGNPLSCFIANIFMANLEWNLSNHHLFPRLWRRYVDDVLVIAKPDSIEPLLELMNNQHPSIKFTIEKEEQNSLPFLDLLLTRKKEKIEIAVYRKSTNTDRYITNTSFTTHQNKFASFNSMVHRLCRLPLNITNFMNELKTIKHIASVNGFCGKQIDQLVVSHSRKTKLRKITTLRKERDNDDNLKYCKFSYLGTPSLDIAKVLRPYNIKCVFANKGKIKELLGNPKDKPSSLKVSGIYSIQCADCPAKYVGQTQRPIEKRFSEHVNNVKNQEVMKSSVAKHMIENGHLFTKFNLKLEKAVSSPMFLDAYESFYIQNNEFSMNSDLGPIPSSILKIPTTYN